MVCSGGRAKMRSYIEIFQMVGVIVPSKSRSKTDLIVLGFCIGSAHMGFRAQCATHADHVQVLTIFICQVRFGQVVPA